MTDQLPASQHPAPTRPIEAGWLALREPADTRARDRAADALLPPLLEHLSRSAASPRTSPVIGSDTSLVISPDTSSVIGSDAGPADGQGLRIVDLGAGTGSNLRWLAARLPEPDRQHWMLVDHDPALLARGPVQATAVRADVADLARVLPELGGADLITTAALLDLLDRRELTAIVDAVVEAHLPALFSLTVTGEVTLDPADAQDEPLKAAFDAHQRRDSRPGPGAGTVVADLFRDRGWSVIEARTAWQLTAGSEAELISAWLDGRVEAAVEHQPGLATEAAGWLERRRAQLRSGGLEVVVGHVDLLALPK